jgi:FKBP-type peptidyl-prolyl cis-trans isomerase 2
MKFRAHWGVAAVLAMVFMPQGAGAAKPDKEIPVADGLQVTLEYTLTLPDKTVADSNVGQAPFSYIHGSKQIVPGLEKALTGMKAGEKKHVMVPAEQGYGPYDEKARITVEKSKVPPNVKVGSLLRASTGQTVKVLEVADKSVVLDLNHPLAGKNLTFDVTVLKVEKPGKPETEQPAKPETESQPKPSTKSSTP